MGLPAQPTSPEGPTGVPTGLTVFVSADAGLTPYTATYTGDLVFEDLAGAVILGVNEGFTFKEREQRMLRIGGNVGVRFPITSSLLLTAGFGGSYLELQEENLIQSPTGSSFQNQHTEFRTLEPNPGFAATLAVDWEALRRSHFSLITGLKLLYVSSYGLRGTSLEGESSGFTQDLITSQQLPGNELFYADLATVDMSLHILSIQPHAGVEWRAVDSYLVNSFGVFANAVVSSGTLVKEVTLQTDLVPSTGNPADITSSLHRESTELGLSLSPLQFMGAYYGWYLSIPHFGTLGAEVQAGGRWNAEISYQYTY